MSDRPTPDLGATVPPAGLGTAAAIVGFWRDAGYERWFRRDATFDRACEARLLAAHHQAARRELEAWLQVPEGALALVLLLDQVPRNVFRGSAHSYATDGLARQYAVRAIDAGFDLVVEPTLRIFFYMPFEHSETLADQDRGVALTAAMDSADGAVYLEYARRHREVIRRFGRFPQRNAALGRETTPEEQAWLDTGGGFS